MKKECVPSVLMSLAEKWEKEGKEIYLSSKNICQYKGKKIQYMTHMDEFLKDGWYIKNGEVSEDYELSLEDIKEIAKLCMLDYHCERWNLSLDYRCNYHCPMCQFHSTQNQDYKIFEKYPEYIHVVTKEEAFSIIDRLAAMKIKAVSICSNGEPLLYPHFWDVAEYANKNGIEPWTITNASLLNEDACKRMRDLGFRNIKISLDALSFETYSKLRSSKREDFDRAMNAPLLLKKYGMVVTVDMVQQEQNKHEVSDFVEYWKKQPVDKISVSILHVRDDKGVHAGYEIEKEPFVPGMCINWEHYLIYNDGTIYPCCGVHSIKDYHLSENIKDVSLETAVQHTKAIMDSERKELINICEDCPYYALTYEIEDDGIWETRKSRIGIFCTRKE